MCVHPNSSIAIIFANMNLNLLYLSGLTSSRIHLVENFFQIWTTKATIS